MNDSDMEACRRASASFAHDGHVSRSDRIICIDGRRGRHHFLLRLDEVVVLLLRRDGRLGDF